MLTQERLKEVLHYDPDTGIFTWLKKTGRRSVVGNRAGSVKNDGYRLIGVDGIRYLEHRLAYLYMTGSFPNQGLDHEDTNKANNKWDNLREATQSNNICNTPLRTDNASGYKGVCWRKGSQKWTAHCTADGKKHHLGTFDTPELAKTARDNFALQHHKEFFNQG